LQNPVFANNNNFQSSISQKSDFDIVMSPYLLNLYRSLTSRRLEEEEQDETFGWENHAWTRENEVIIAEYLLVFFLLIVATLYLQYFVGKVWKLHWLPESGATMLFGMAIGGIIRLSGASTEDKDSGASMLGFDSTVFFLGSVC
jgi:hypothetical protein